MSTEAPPRPDNEHTEGRAAWGVLGFAAGLLITVATAIVVFIVTDQGPEAAPEPNLPATGLDQITVVGTEFAFDPETMVLSPGASITLDNQGVVVHNLEIEGVDGFKVEAEAGATATAEIDADPGNYVIFCSIVGHREAGMVGTLTVAEG